MKASPQCLFTSEKAFGLAPSDLTSQSRALVYLQVSKDFVLARALVATMFTWGEAACAIAKLCRRLHPTKLSTAHHMTWLRNTSRQRMAQCKRSHPGAFREWLTHRPRRSYPNSKKRDNVCCGSRGFSSLCFWPRCRWRRSMDYRTTWCVFSGWHRICMHERHPREKRRHHVRPRRLQSSCVSERV